MTFYTLIYLPFCNSLGTYTKLKFYQNTRYSEVAPYFLAPLFWYYLNIVYVCLCTKCTSFDEWKVLSLFLDIKLMFMAVNHIFINISTFLFFGAMKLCWKIYLHDSRGAALLAYCQPGLHCFTGDLNVFPSIRLYSELSNNLKLQCPQ